MRFTGRPYLPFDSIHRNSKEFSEKYKIFEGWVPGNFEWSISILWLNVFAKKLEGLKLASGTRTAEDDHDAWVKDKQSFIGKSRITQADEKGDRSSVVRSLDKPLHLIVDRNFGYQNNSKAKPEYNWDLPSSIRQEGESMRQVAERAVRNTCGSDLNVHILGNAPWAFFKYRYSNKIQDITGKRGEKIFIYKAHYQSGQAKAQENISRDYKWSTIDELDESIAPKLKVILKELIYIGDCES